MLFGPMFLGGCIGPTIHTQDAGARQAAAKAQIASFRAALQAYRNDVGEFPTETQGLQALRTDPSVDGWNGPYLPKDVPADPWGVPYRYRLVRDQPEIVSLGVALNE